MKIHLLTILLALPFFNYGQYCGTFSLTEEADIELGCTKNTLTALHDQNDRDYIYAANSQGGLTVIGAEDPENLINLINLPGSTFNNLNVNSITQEGDYLYVALGDLFGSHVEPSGLAIVNIENPESPFVEDVWESEENAGAAFVAVRGHLAYLCGLANGIFVLNIADKSNILFVSQFVPEKNWPSGTDEAKINARNIVLEGDLGYLAYDAGGVRIIDISNPLALAEVGRYSNPAMDGAARAYNNIVKRDDLLYVAVDYAGVEILDVSNTEAISLEGWWNPNDFPLATPAATSLVWFESEWHTNEIHLVEECNFLIVSCGRTEAIGIDVSDPSTPTLCGTFGVPDDNNSTWGLTVYKDRVYMGMICTFGVPFPGGWSGVKSLVLDSACPLNTPENLSQELSVFPNPAQNNITVNSTAAIETIHIYNQTGQLVLSEQHTGSSTLTFSIAHLPAGIYFLSLQTNGQKIHERIVIQ